MKRLWLVWGKSFAHLCFVSKDFLVLKKSRRREWRRKFSHESVPTTQPDFIFPSLLQDGLPHSRRTAAWEAEVPASARTRIQMTLSLALTSATYQGKPIHSMAFVAYVESSLGNFKKSSQNNSETVIWIFSLMRASTLRAVSEGHYKWPWQQRGYHVNQSQLERESAYKEIKQ